MPTQRRPRLVASMPSTTKLFVDDLREVNSLSKDEGKYRSDVIRDLVHEALRLRRLRAIGRDEGENYVRTIHREVVAEGVAPVLKELAELRRRAEILSTGCGGKSQGFDAGDSLRTGESLSLLLPQILRRVVVTENIVKVLMTVGMQTDEVNPEEIRKQLASHDETGLRQARQSTQALLGDRQQILFNEGS
jgi:hypothetical protein